jgi:hypothetical protein
VKLVGTAGYSEWLTLRDLIHLCTMIYDQ